LIVDIKYKKIIKQLTVLSLTCACSNIHNVAAARLALATTELFSIVVGLEEEEDDDTDTGHMVTLVCEVVDVE
jgi:hypothetical protein